MSLDSPVPNADDAGSGRGEPGETSAAAPPGGAARGRAFRRWRWAAAWLLVVLVSFGVALSALTIWSNRVLLDTNEFVSTVEPIARDPAVSQAVSTVTSEQIVSALSIDQRARDALPERAQFLATPLTDTVVDLVSEQLARLLQRQDLQDAWVRALRFAHEAVVTVLRGGTRIISTANGEVTLNLFPLIDAGLRLVERLGILPSDVTLPDLSNVTPAEGRARLEQSLGRQLPSGFGEVTLVRSEGLRKAQRGVRIFDDLTVVLPLVTLALAAVALVVSPRRRLTAIHLGIGAVLALVLVRALFRIAGHQLAGAVRGEPLGSAVASAGVTTLTDSLTAFTAPLIVTGVAVALAAFLAGHLAWLRAGWSRVRAPLGTAQQPSRAAHWLRSNLAVMQLGGLALAVVVLLFADLTWGLLLLFLLLVSAYQAALWLLYRGAAPTGVSSAS